MSMTRIHCSYHKCLTVYLSRVIEALFRSPLADGTYRHFNSRLEEFNSEYSGYSVASVNNHVLDLDSLGDFRITRLVRDPRDLVVSGYLYHRRGAEDWCDAPVPSDERFRVVNGHVSSELAQSGLSFKNYLQSVSEEQGLLAELDFRRYHFESMAAWPTDDERVRVFRYEDIVGSEASVMYKILRHLKFRKDQAALGAVFSQRRSAARVAGSHAHVRDPRSGQWRSRFTPLVEKVFEERHGELLDRYGYR